MRIQQQHCKKLSRDSQEAKPNFELLKLETLKTKIIL
jgi:hypothetical protein